MAIIQEQKTPKLRFPEFSNDWKMLRIEQLLSRKGKPVQVSAEQKYREIGIRSHGKGIFHKESIYGKSLGNKRVFEVYVPAFVVNIVFAWEHAIALTTESERGFIASHRFPMFISKNGKSDLSFIRYFFLRKYGKHLLGLVSPGGAGRNKTLGQKDFAKLKVIVPDVTEQGKIVSFLSSVDTKIEQLGVKISLLKQYKRGMMQKIFHQETRFNDEYGNKYPNWEKKRLEDLVKLSAGASKSKYIDKRGANFIIDMGAISSEGKLIPSKRTSLDQDFLTTGQLVMPKDDIGKGKIIGKAAYIDSDFKYILADHVYLLDVEHGNSKFLSYLINSYDTNKSFRRKANGTAQLGLARKAVLGQEIVLPQNIKEQENIADFLSAIDKKIDLVGIELEKAQTFKKGLLQQMFI